LAISGFAAVTWWMDCVKRTHGRPTPPQVYCAASSLLLLAQERTFMEACPGAVVWVRRASLAVCVRGSPNASGGTVVDVAGDDDVEVPGIEKYIKDECVWLW
jgi:hypothetical protein